MKKKKSIRKLNKSAEKITTVLIHEALQASLDEEAARAQRALLSPSLSSIKSEYQKLCDELSGPVEGIAPNINRSI
jgi:cellobiose-specific phosphotransferase system component IIB